MLMHRYLLQHQEDDGTWRNFMLGPRPFAVEHIREQERHRWQAIDLHERTDLVLSTDELRSLTPPFVFMAVNTHTDLVESCRKALDLLTGRLPPGERDDVVEDLEDALKRVAREAKELAS